MKSADGTNIAEFAPRGKHIPLEGFAGPDGLVAFLQTEFTGEEDESPARVKLGDSSEGGGD